MKKILILTLAFLLTFGVNVFAADTEVPDLTSEMTAVAAGDLLYITDTSDTGSSNKITVNNLFDHIDTSAELKTILTDEEGSGSAVFATSPTLTTPILTTPTMTDPILGNATATTLIATTGTMDIVGNVTGDLTGSSTETASNADWTIHDSYPADCTNQFVRGLGDTNTCETVVAADVQLLKDIVTTAPLTGAEDNVLVGVDSDLTLAITVLKDLVTTAPLTGGTDNILTGSDADITIAMPVATTSADGYLSQTDWDTFNDKVDNVSTNLSEGTSTETTVDVNSSDGTNATLVSASTSRAGLLTKAKFDEIVANNAKDTNVSTNLSEGTSTTTTVNVNSSDGTNATLVSASTSRAGLLTKAKFDEVVVNSTHSANNTQAHSDYLLNNASDTMTGLLTTTGGLITSASITINSDTSRLYMGATADASTYFDGTDWWFVSPTESKKASDIGSGSGGGAEVNDLETITTDILINEIPIGTGTNTVVYKTAPSCSNATTSKLLYNSTTQELSCGTDQTGGAGGGGFAWQLEPKGAKLPATNPMGIDAGNLQWRGLFDDTTDECARWQSILTPYGAGALDIDIVYSLETASTADTVTMDVYVMCGKNNADMDTDSFDTANSVTSGSVSTTAGYQAKLTGTLTNDDSCAEDDLIIIKICRDASASEDDDDVEFRGASVHE